MPLDCTTDENLGEFAEPARVTTLKRRKRRAPFAPEPSTDCLSQRHSTQTFEETLVVLAGEN